MPQPLTREEAARVLGLSVASGPREVKRAYRELARQHHPDRGGDPHTFQELHEAYQRLVADVAGPSEPVVSRGRPSRPSVPFVDESERADLARVDWDVELPTGTLRLDADRLPVWLAGDGPRLVHPIEASSRAPGSRLNRVAHLLAEELTARLRVAEAADDRGRPVVAVEVVAANRRARRALEAVTLFGGWTRTRRSTSTQVLVTLTPSEDRRATAVRASDRLTALLDTLRWPLTAWTVIAPTDESS